MLLNRVQRNELYEFFKSIRLSDESSEQNRKIEQILAYMEILHGEIRKLSYKRRLVFVDSGAGNCYLSFLIYYFYTRIDPRRLTIHCVDTNIRLMQNCADKANSLMFNQMHFHGQSIEEFSSVQKADLVYTLHACDIATDQALALGVRLGARSILSVSCCQHTLKQQLKGHPYTTISRHRLFKDRLVYMIADSLRALLLEAEGYRTDIIEFVSTRYTDKNVMIRARKTGLNKRDERLAEYRRMKSDFRVNPVLEKYLEECIA